MRISGLPTRESHNSLYLLGGIIWTSIQKLLGWHFWWHFYWQYGHFHSSLSLCLFLSLSHTLLHSPLPTVSLSHFHDSPILHAQHYSHTFSLVLYLPFKLRDIIILSIQNSYQFKNKTEYQFWNQTVLFMIILSILPIHASYLSLNNLTPWVKSCLQIKDLIRYIYWSRVCLQSMSMSPDQSTWDFVAHARLHHTPKYLTLDSFENNF